MKTLDKNVIRARDLNLPLLGNPGKYDNTFSIDNYKIINEFVKISICMDRLTHGSRAVNVYLTNNKIPSSSARLEKIHWVMGNFKSMLL